MASGLPEIEESLFKGWKESGKNKPIFFIPSMNTQMWENKINKKNINYLKSVGVEFFGPKIGKLKCGEYGIGRIEDTKIIVNYLYYIFSSKNIRRVAPIFSIF